MNRMAALAVALAALLMAGCAEREVILTGEREDLRAGQAETRLPRAPDMADNQSRAIRLPAQKANTNWTQGFGSAVYRTDHPALSPTPARIWSVDIGAGDARRARITADPVVGGGLIYTLDSGAQVSGVNPAGAVVWRTDLVPPTDDVEQATGGGMAYADGTLYVSSGYGRLTALDAASGAVRWRQRLDATGSGTPLVHDGLVYVVAGDDTAWAVRTDNGRIAWQVQATPSVANVLGAPAPALAGKFTIFAFGSGEVTGAFRRGGTQRWTTTVSGERIGSVAARIGDITGSPVVVGDLIYVGNHSGRTAALDAQTGERLWTVRQGTLGPIWPSGGSLFMVSDFNQLARLDAADGSVIWVQDLPGFVKDKPKRRAEIYAHYGPILAGGRIVVASNDGLLRFYAPQDGTLVNTVEVPGGATTGPVVANRTLYVVSRTGQLHAYR
jgi:outer membrane protein assembly factor BamB